uniref:Capsid protein n=1 Tax=Hubei levi-like virus 2 TaxID=1922914 RepID=A0A1L3KIF5_9VIRU|nr:hypothetical protein [Hubei levi-like virus 2]
MTTSITIKDSAGTDTVFTVVRQPSGNQSAILHAVNVTAGMNRTGYAKVELSTRIVNGKTTPVASVTVPFGAVVNGNFVKSGQVSDTRQATQPADAPEKARLDAAAFAKNLAANAQVAALFETGLI